ncbi:MAG: hypothetical protein AB1421_15125 [Pseudomonadota bacterium]
MKYMIEYAGPPEALREAVQSLGGVLAPAHPLSYAAMALDARAASANYLDSPQDFLRRLARNDSERI